MMAGARSDGSSMEINGYECTRMNKCQNDDNCSVGDGDDDTIQPDQLSHDFWKFSKISGQRFSEF